MSRPLDKQGLIELLEPPLRALGFELVDLDVFLGRRGLLRLYIDREPAVTLADCELVSQQLGAFLDVEDPLPGSYVLEVSSPGMDRRLRTLEHFERFVDEEVRVELKRVMEGRRRLKGRLTGVEDGRVCIVVDGTTWQLSLEDMAEARLVPERGIKQRRVKDQ